MPFILTHPIFTDTVAMLHEEVRAGYGSLALELSNILGLSYAAWSESEKQPLQHEKAPEVLGFTSTSIILSGFSIRMCCNI